MERIKRKPQETEDVVAYLLEIAGTRPDAETAADKWGVRIHIFGEIVEKGQNIVLAVCPAADVVEAFEWHEAVMPYLQKGITRPGT